MGEAERPGIPSILKRILEKRRERLVQQMRLSPLAELRRHAADAPPVRGFREALARPGVRIIAEIKRRSPSRGVIREDFDVPALAAAYAEGGADALSVLTEEDFFEGSLAHLETARETAAVPVLRKDFLFEGYQLYEARAAGADAVLLIVAALEQAHLCELLELSAELGLGALVEVHDAAELDRALAARAEVIGINNRDLHTFEVSLATSTRLAARIPADRTVVGESGIHGPEDIAVLRDAGISAFLIGEHFMRQRDVAAAVRRLKADARKEPER